MVSADSAFDFSASYAIPVGALDGIYRLSVISPAPWGEEIGWAEFAIDPDEYPYVPAHGFEDNAQSWQSGIDDPLDRAMAVTMVNRDAR